MPRLTSIDICEDDRDHVARVMRLRNPKQHRVRKAAVAAPGRFGLMYRCVRVYRQSAGRHTGPSTVGKGF